MIIFVHYWLFTGHYCYIETLLTDNIFYKLLYFTHICGYLD